MTTQRTKPEVLSKGLGVITYVHDQVPQVGLASYAFSFPTVLAGLWFQTLLFTCW